MAPLYLLDNDALSWLTSHDAARARHRAVAATRAGDIRVLITHILLDETCRTRRNDDGRFRAMVDLLGTLAKGHTMLDPIKRRFIEVRSGGALKRDELADPALIFAPSFDPVIVDRAAENAAARARTSIAEEATTAAAAAKGLQAEARRQILLDVLEDDVPGQDRALNAWRKEFKTTTARDKWALNFAAEFARDDIADYAARVGCPIPHVDPSLLPTFWASAAVHVARIREVLVNGVRPDGRRAPGFPDLSHLKEAMSYADGFVTRDARLILFAAKVRGVRCEAIHVESWADHF